MNKIKISTVKKIFAILLMNLIAATHLFSIDLSEGYNFGGINLYLSKQRILCYHDSGFVKSTDEYILKHYDTLFNAQPQNIINNVVKDSKTTLWMYFTIDTTLSEDYIIKCLPYYKSVSLFYYSEDSILHRQYVGNQLSFKDWDFKSNMYAFKLPNHTLNRYFVKYEFYDSFPIGAF